VESDDPTVETGLKALAMTSPVIIIGFAEALSAPEVAWSLVDHGFTVVAFSRRGKRTGLRRSRLIRVVEVTAPESDWARTLQDLQGLVAKEWEAKPPAVAVMPLDDRALWLCGRAEWPEGTRLIGPTGKALELALSKPRQLELAGASGFFVPRWLEAQRAEDVRGHQLAFPLVFKPALAASEARGHLGRGRSWLCADAGELEAAVQAWGGEGPMLLQEYVPGVGEGLFGLATTEGVLAWSGHRRLRMMNPQGSGSSACAGVARLDPEAQRAGERLLAGAGWRGLFMIELLRDANGRLWFIEFNGRAWGSMALARRAGLEYPAWAAQITLEPGRALAKPEMPVRTLVCRHLAREVLYLLFVLRGARSKALTTWPSFWRACFEVLRFGRNERWYNWRKDDPGVFAGDCLATLREQLFEARGRS
jgi:predicted ATP-grasp superfamily ATP-dependent carboligase